MDLSFTAFETGGAGADVDAALALVLVSSLARQAASATAIAQAELARSHVPAQRLRPLGGSFCDGTASALTRWKGR